MRPLEKQFHSFCFASTVPRIFPYQCARHHPPTSTATPPSRIRRAEGESCTSAEVHFTKADKSGSGGEKSFSTK